MEKEKTENELAIKFFAPVKRKSHGTTKSRKNARNVYIQLSEWAKN